MVRFTLLGYTRPSGPVMPPPIHPKYDRPRLGHVLFKEARNIVCERAEAAGGPSSAGTGSASGSGDRDYIRGSSLFDDGDVDEEADEEEKYDESEECYDFDECKGRGRCSGRYWEGSSDTDLEEHWDAQEDVEGRVNLLEGYDGDEEEGEECDSVYGDDASTGDNEHTHELTLRDVRTFRFFSDATVYCPAPYRYLTCGTKQFDDLRLHFGVVSTLQVPQRCNNYTGVRVGRSLAPPARDGRGFARGSIWVVKSYPEPELITDEIRAYRRIAAHRERARELGHLFLAECEATVTFAGTYGLVLPLARYDLRQSYAVLLASEVRPLMAQIALGLATLHGMGIVHGNLTPDNILIDARWVVKIAGFGCSYVEDASTGSLDRAPIEYVSLGRFAEAYAAPERSMFAIGTPMDYWSLGCVFYELIVFAERRLGYGPWDNILFNRISVEDWKARPGFHCLPKDGKMADGASLSLLMGLLRPRYQDRFTIEDMLNHRYFRNSDSQSEFKVLYRYLYSTATDLLERSPDKPEPRLELKSNYPQDGTFHRWINSRGSFFADWVG